MINVDSSDIDIQSPESTAVVSTDINIKKDTSNTVESHKNEYSVIGDGLYASVTADEAPQWLTALIDNVVEASVSAGLTDYASLVQNVHNAIDSINVAKNTYVEQIGITPLVDGIVTSKLETLNAAIGDTYATKVDLSTAVATSEQALAQSVTSLNASFSDTIDSRITEIRTVFSNEDSALADDISALQSSFEDQESNLAATSTAVSGLQTYVGIDDSNTPNGTGMLARLSIVEKQNDGIIETFTGVYDVMKGVEYPNTDVDNDELDVTKEPYSTWLASDVANGTTRARSSHVGDVFIKYTSVDSGYKNYDKAYKFIRTIVDETSPYSTDTEGFTWALITDTDTQNAYVAALNALDLADNKRRVFVDTPSGPYDEGDLWVRNIDGSNQLWRAVSDRAIGYLLTEWDQVSTDDKAVNDYADHVTNTIIPSLENQIDSKLEYWFTPSTDDPKSGWTVNERVNRSGDVWYQTDTKKSFYYTSSNNSWNVISDSDALQAILDASNAYALADGKISQFYAWGGANAPADYVIVNADGNNETIPGNNFKYWFKNSTLYYKPNTTWAVVPNGIGAGPHLAEGDLLTVFDPNTRDYTRYNYNGTSWQQNGPTGVISKSKFFVDLENEVTGPNGHVASSLNSLQLTSEAYADAEGARVENKFDYDSSIIIDDVYYKAGFGLEASGVSGGSGTEADPYDSEFWVNAERFKFTNPNKTGGKAPFSIDASGTTPQIYFNGVVNFSNVSGTPTNSSGSGAPTGTAVQGSTYIQTNTDPDTVWVYNSGWKITGDPTGIANAATAANNAQSAADTAQGAADDAQETADSAFTLADGKISAYDIGPYGSTTISGNRITTGSLDAALLTTGIFKTNGLDIADSTDYSNYTGTIIDSDGIRVYESGTLRVKIGNI